MSKQKQGKAVAPVPMKFNRVRVKKGTQVLFEIPENSTFLELRVISGEWFAYFEDSGETTLKVIELSIKKVGDPIEDTEFFNNMIGSAVLKAVYRKIL